MAKKKNTAKERKQNMEQTHQAPEELEAMDAQDSEFTAVSEEEFQAEAQQEECKIGAELEAALAKQEEYLSLAQRVQADFENFRRRNQSVRKESFDDGARTFVSTLLPVVDNMERAIAAAKDTSDPSLREGIEMVYRQLCEVFAKRGIETIDRMGEKFDPTLENAVMQGGADDGEPGTVCEVLQKGYQMEGMVIRHAMVKVVPE